MGGLQSSFQERRRNSRTSSSGSTSSRKASLKNLARTTHFSHEELGQLRKAFFKDYPQGWLNSQQFQQVVHAFLPFDLEACKFGEHLFRSCDSDKNGRLCFEEFAHAMSLFQRGSATEKLDWIFRMYDVDGNGEITREGMQNVLASVIQIKELEGDRSAAAATRKARWSSSSREGDLEAKVRSLEKKRREKRVSCLSDMRVASLFDLLDKERRGTITRDQFLDTVNCGEPVRSRVLSSLDFKLPDN